MFAAIGKVRYAIIALGAIVFMTWLNYMPSVVRTGSSSGASTRSRRRGADHRLPADGRLRHRLAARNQRLGVATALVSIPTFYSLLGVIVFAISVSITGSDRNGVHDFGSIDFRRLLQEPARAFQWRKGAFA